jgi:Zn finger protein HypA/HybF involved in hydrogenase expression
MAALEIATGLTSLKTALDIAKALWTIDNAAERSSKILDLQRAIGEAQLSAINAREAHSAQIDRIRDLEQEIVRLKAWDGEKERYELKNVWHGAMVYALKPSMSGGEPAHWLCANCYTQGKKRFLQAIQHGVASTYWGCPECKSNIITSGAVAPV